MVYSAKSDVKLVVRSMRAGAREFLNSAGFHRRHGRGPSQRSTPNAPPRARSKDRARQKLFVFLGSKGGCGVTTLASNFAVCVAQESGQSTLLIDLGTPLGRHGHQPRHGSQVLRRECASGSRPPRHAASSPRSSSKHSSGLNVLAAPNEFPSTQPTIAGIDKLISVARQNFDYVVVDAGSRARPEGILRSLKMPPSFTSSPRSASPSSETPIA